MISIAATLAALQFGWIPTGFAWNQGQFPIPYCVNTNGTNTQLTAQQQGAEIDRAVNYWRSTGGGGGTSCTTWDAVRDTRTCTPVVDGNDGQNNILFERNNWQHGSQVLGVTWSGGGGNCGAVTDSTGRRWNLTCQNSPDIELNDTQSNCWDATGNQCTDLASIITHEYGHFLGLDHCNLNNTCSAGTAVMYAAYLGGQMRPPRADDTQGVCALYPGTPGGVGFPCSGNGNCTSTMCISPAANGYCTATCGTCPSGYSCTMNPAFPGQNICIRDDGTNRAVCEVCQSQLPNACANSGICVAGIPEANAGRCAIPCPQPGQPMGGCPNLYTCATIPNAGYYCIPRSSDCTNLNNIVELQMGQACTGNPACAAGLDCLSICTKHCTGVPGQGDCPAGYACATFNLTGGMMADYCAPPVNEGQNCDGLKACPSGPCLTAPGGTTPTCFKDCGAGPNACNNAQMCTTYMLTGGGMVSVCEPPGVPPRPDGGLAPDTGMTMMTEDSGTGPGPDTGTPPGVDSGQLMSMPDAGGNTQGCSCDQFTYCEPNCPCDAECPCACDLHTNCDSNCSCDPDCFGNNNNNGGDPGARTSGGCVCVTGRPEGAPILAILAIGLVVVRRRRLG